MTLDQYQLCPCGSGKKVKFCCSREFVHDLERILRMVQGDQRLAALEKTEALLAKYPDRPALLMTKAEIELQLEEAAKARETIERLVQVDPKNPSVFAMRSLLAVLLDGNLNAAIHSMQDAFEMADSVVTARMYEAIVVLANMLLRVGLPAASKGHLQLALALSNAKDERSAQALMQLNHSRQIPLVLREPLALYDCPPNVTWRIEFQGAMRDVFRGRWRLGAKTLAAMSARILDAPAILYNQAVVLAWLGDNPNATKAFRQFSRIRDISWDDRVQAAAIAECLDPDTKKSVVDVVERTWEIQEFDRAMEQCLSNKQLLSVPIDRHAAHESDEPLPRAMWEVLDKPLPTGGNLQISDIPEAWGRLLLFGKETDRPARLTIQCARSRCEKIEQLCQSLVGKELGQPVSDQVVDGVPWFGTEIFAAWRIPDNLAVDERTRLQAELRRHSLLERWPNTPSPIFDGKTPTEAAADNQYKIAVLADLLNLEIIGQDSHWDVDFNGLRRQLQLPERTTIDPGTVDFDRLPVHRFSLLKVKELNDDQLLTVYRRAYAVMAVWPLRQIALEVISRESLDDKIDKVEAYDILSDVAASTDEALEYLAKARRLATTEGESPAAWLIDELEIRLLRGEFDKFAQLLKEIQTRYIKEPGVAPSVIEVLSRYGLVTSDGRVMIPTAAAAPAEAAEATSLWTPDSDKLPTAGGGETKHESKLWIPGMD
jgi:tetratricopeptide (TPR) repeat protein